MLRPGDYCLSQVPHPNTPQFDLFRGALGVTIELALSPFFLLPIPLIPWCLRRWPRVTTAQPADAPTVGV